MSADLFNGIPQTIADISSHLGPLAKGLDLAAMASKKFKDSTARYMDMVEALKAIDRAAAGGIDRFKEQRKVVEAAYNQMIKAAQGAQSLSKAHAELDKAVKNNETSYEKFSKSIKSAQGVMGKWLPLFGGQTITIAKSVESLKKYNQSMFTLQRTYQVAGQGSQNFSKALDNVSKRTTLSANQFLDFAKAVNGSWKGIAPGISMVGDLAAAFQDKLGPTLEATQEGLKATMTLMDKFPAIAKANIAAIVALQNQDKGADKQIASSKAMLKILLASGKIDLETYRTKMKLMSGVTAEQNKQIDTNKELAKVAQKFEDTMLNLGKSIQPAIKGMATELSKMADIMSRMPLLISSIAMAFRMIDAKLLSSAASSLGNSAKNLAGGGVAAGNIAKGVGVKGFLGAAGNFAMAGAGGYAAGTMIDQAFGISDWAGRRSGRKTDKKLATENLGYYLPQYQEKYAKMGYSDKFKALGGEKEEDPVKKWEIAQKALKEVVEEQKGVNKSSKEIAKAQKEAAEEAKDFAVFLHEAKANSEAIVALADQLLGTYEKQTDALLKAGVINSSNVDEFFDKQINSINNSAEAARGYFKLLGSSDGLLSNLKELEIDMGPEFDNIISKLKDTDIEVLVESGEFDKAIKMLQDKHVVIDAEVKPLIDEKRKDINDTDPKNTEEITKLNEELETLLAKQQSSLLTVKSLEENRVKIQTQGLKVADIYAQKADKAVEKEMQLNQATESRIDAERAVVEAGMIGMGASLEMMQKQVDFAYELMEVEKRKQQMMVKNTALSLKAAGIEQDKIGYMMEQMNAAKSGSHAQEIAISLTGKNESATSALLSYYEKMEGSQANIYKHQQKIYELTKETREGYLDAIREMSVGAGEFEKIISTQEMGMTQFVESADNVGQSGVMDSFKMGGMQSKEMTAAGVGGSYMGSYGAGAGGPVTNFQNKDLYQQGLSRYAGYAESVANVEAMSRVEGQRATVGGASAMTEGYEGALREDELSPAEQKKMQTDAVCDGMIKYGKTQGGLRGVSPMYQPGGGGNPAANVENIDKNAGWQFGAYTAGRHQGGEADDTTRSTGKKSNVNTYASRFTNEPVPIKTGRVEPGINTSGQSKVSVSNASFKSRGGGDSNLKGTTNVRRSSANDSFTRLENHKWKKAERADPFGYRTAKNVNQQGQYDYYSPDPNALVGNGTGRRGAASTTYGARSMDDINFHTTGWAANREGSQQVREGGMSHLVDYLKGESAMDSYDMGAYAMGGVIGSVTDGPVASKENVKERLLKEKNEGLKLERQKIDLKRNELEFKISKKIYQESLISESAKEKPSQPRRWGAMKTQMNVLSDEEKKRADAAYKVMKEAEDKVNKQKEFVKKTQEKYDASMSGSKSGKAVVDTRKDYESSVGEWKTASQEHIDAANEVTKLGTGGTVEQRYEAREKEKKAKERREQAKAKAEEKKKSNEEAYAKHNEPLLGIQMSEIQMDSILNEIQENDPLKYTAKKAKATEKMKDAKAKATEKMKDANVGEKIVKTYEKTYKEALMFMTLGSSIKGFKGDSVRGADKWDKEKAHEMAMKEARKTGAEEYGGAINPEDEKKFVTAYMEREQGKKSELEEKRKKYYEAAEKAYNESIKSAPDLSREERHEQASKIGEEAYGSDMTAEEKKIAIAEGNARKQKSKEEQNKVYIEATEAKFEETIQAEADATKKSGWTADEIAAHNKTAQAAGKAAVKDKYGVEMSDEDIKSAEAQGKAERMKSQLAQGEKGKPAAQIAWEKAATQAKTAKDPYSGHGSIAEQRGEVSDAETQARFNSPEAQAAIAEKMGQGGDGLVAGDAGVGGGSGLVRVEIQLKGPLEAQLMEALGVTAEIRGAV